MQINASLQYVVWFFATVALVEALISYARGARKNSSETLANFGVFLVRRVISSVFENGFKYSLLLAISVLAPVNLKMTPTLFLLLLVLMDFIYWFKHYCEHRCRFLWAFHSVHHSSHEFNLSTALRLPWFGGFFTWIFYVPPILLGFDPLAVLACNQIILLYQFWIHSEFIPKLGVFEKVFNSPSHHRVHHASNVECLDKNFGGILIVWDRIFSTFQEEKNAIVYGLTKPLNTTNPVRINIDEPMRLAQDIRRSLSLKEAWRVFINGPEYIPAHRKSRK